MRLSITIAKTYNLSRREAKEYIKNGLVKVNNSIVTSDIDIIDTDIIKFQQSCIHVDFNINDYLLSSHHDVIFLYKPPFMHYERIRQTDSLTMSDVVATLNGYHGLSRLDYEADGVIACINDNIAITNIKKKYYAIASGKFPDIIEVSWSIDAHKRKSVKVIENSNGYHTKMKNIKYTNGYSLIEVELEKAARHQVRAFCANTGHPILGDKLYGGNTFDRLCLHCFEYTINGYTQTSEKYTNKFIDMIDKLVI